jgi:hypothetical protein
VGLVRPYDLVLLGGIRVLAIASTEPPRRWPRAAAPLLGLLPVLVYDLLLFFGSEQFASFRRGATIPPWIDFVPALAPAAALALASLRRSAPDEAARRARAHLWAWVAAGATVILARAGGFSLQLVVGAGLPVLVLGAAGLTRLAPGWTALAALLMSTSSLVATRIALAEDPNWFVPRQRLATARALSPLCRPCDRVLAPPDIGLYAIGLSACHAFVAHPAAPDYPARLTETRAFYSGMSPAARTELLDRQGLSHLVLPGHPGPRPLAWLGAATPFRAAARVGSPSDEITIYERPRPAFPARCAGERVR